MKPTRSLPLMGTLLALIAATFVLAGSAVLTPSSASAQPTECVATGATLDEAKAAYADTCTDPRVDCDLLDGLWNCSNLVIGDAAPGGVKAPTPAPTPDADADADSDPTPEPSAPAPTTPAVDDTPDCTAAGSTLSEAKTAYAAVCSAPRVDCDFNGAWTCSSGVIGAAAPGGVTAPNPVEPQTPTNPTPLPVDPTPIPVIPGPDGCPANGSGQVDLSRDLISLQYDHAPDRDDGHATAAAKEVATTIGFTPWVIGGAYGAGNANSYRSASEAVMDAVWGPANWVNADADWNAAVQRSADRWQLTLENCGDIWIAEGGQSDLSADIVRELRRRMAGLSTVTRIHLVQHSNWNESQALDADLAYVRKNTDYIRIPDGNGGGNGTADFNDENYDGPFISRALNGPNRLGWIEAFDYYSPDERLDFSDTVELMHILGVGTNEVNNIEEFADRFLRSGPVTPEQPTSVPEPTSTAEPEPTAEPELTTVAPETTPNPEPPLDDPEPTPDAPVDGVLVEQTYAANDGPDRNPMKGWNSGWSNDRPESTVGFQYIKWKDFEPTNGVFDFSAVEDVINRSGSRDRHLVLRLYCDWWGEDETSRGCPEWMYSEVGVDRIQGDNGRYITDYNDPRYIDEAVQAIQALGARYDDDPRMYTIQLGVLGYWGEWHSWGSQIDGQQYEISQTTQSRILNAYLDAFDRVHVMGRQPWGEILSTSGQIGFHNDYFRPNNGHSADFDQDVSASGLWANGPIGGEIPPGLSSDDFFHLYGTSQGQQMIELGHYSTMKPASVDGQYRDDHLELHRRFGYNYRIESAQFSASADQDGTAQVALAVRNVGIAPFYYNWEIQFGLVDEAGNLAGSTRATYDLRNAGPNSTFDLTGAIDLDGIAAGDYQVAVRIVQPGADQTKALPWGLDARNTYIVFANDLPVIDGQWNSANALVGGWSILGATSVG